MQTSSTKGKKSKSKATPERRAQLLRVARRSRIKWIQGEGVLNIKLDSEKDKHTSLLPITSSLQPVFNFLSDTISDGEEIDVECLLPSSSVEEEDDELEMLPSVPEYALHVPPYWTFTEKLKHPGALEIVLSIQKFVISIQDIMRENARKLTAESVYKQKKQDIINSIWSFMSQTLQTMRTNFLWEKELSTNWEKTKESFEKFVFLKLHSCLFGSGRDDVFEDRSAAETISSLSFLSPEHLDIKSFKKVNVTQLLRPAVEALQKIGSACCPNDKLLCIKQCSQEIIEALRSVRPEGDSSLPGADEYLPVLILVVKDARISNLASNISYLQSYMHPSKLVSESGYILTNFVSAVHFLRTCDSKALTISPAEFEGCIAKSNETARSQTAQLLGSYQSDEGGSSYQKQNVKFSLLQSEVPKVKMLDATSIENEESEPTARSIYSRRKQPQHLPVYKKATSVLEISKSPDDIKLSTDATNSFSKFHRSFALYQKGMPGASSMLGSHGFLDAEVETLRLDDVPRLLAEYKYISKACSALLSIDNV